MTSLAPAITQASVILSSGVEEVAALADAMASAADVVKLTGVGGRWVRTPGGVLVPRDLSLADVDPNHYGKIASIASNVLTMEPGHTIEEGDEVTFWDETAYAILGTSTAAVVAGNDVTVTSVPGSLALGDRLYTQNGKISIGDNGSYGIWLHKSSNAAAGTAGFAYFDGDGFLNENCIARLGFLSASFILTMGRSLHWLAADMDVVSALNSSHINFGLGVYDGAQGADIYGSLNGARLAGRWEDGITLGSALGGSSAWTLNTGKFDSMRSYVRNNGGNSWAFMGDVTAEDPTTNGILGGLPAVATTYPHTSVSALVHVSYPAVGAASAVVSRLKKLTMVYQGAES